MNVVAGRAAWSEAVRNHSYWVILIIWIIEAMGFGVVMNYLMFRQYTDNPVPGVDPGELRQAMLTESFASFSPGSVPFYGIAMALVFGAITVGREYQNGTVTLIYTQGPRRIQVIGAQLISVVGLAAIMTVVTYIFNALGLLAVSLAAGWPIAAPGLGATIISFITSWLTLSVYGIVGAALAVITRSAMRAIVIGLIWVLAAENAIIAILQSIGFWDSIGSIFLAGATSQLAVARGSFPWWPGALSDSVTAGEGWLAALTLIIWAAIAAAVAVALVRRRDI